MRSYAPAARSRDARRRCRRSRAEPRSRALQRQGLPEEPASNEHGLEPGCAGDAQNRRWLMEEEAELASEKPLRGVDHPDPETDPPAPGGEGQDQPALRVSRDRAQESSEIRIAAHHTMENDRVSGVDVFAVAREITDPSVDAIGHSCLDGEVARGLLVGRRNLDVHRSRGTRTDEIELQRTDPSADLEDRPARYPPGDKEVADHPRSAAETIPPVGASVRSRAVGVDDANETVRIAARGHGTNFSASGRRARPP